MKRLTDYVVFNDEKLERKYATAPIPMSVLYEAYFDGDIDIIGDVEALLRERHEFVKYTITRQHLQWAVKNYVPDITTTGRNQDARNTREVFDRGNDFFEWFLGSSMAYTTGLFMQRGDSLEEAQRHQRDQVADRLQIQPGQRVLEVGCGWGSLVVDLAQRLGADVTGLTLSAKQAEFANRQIANAGLDESARVLQQSYKDVSSDEKFDRIICMEMIEHVGLKNLSSFYEKVCELLTDDGIFMLQWTGLRRGLRPEDLIWGLFVGKYVFPGADAALPPSSMLKAMEKAGFEMHSIENISGHYAETLAVWRRNWVANRGAILAAYGERWFRIWNFFLAWSMLVAEQGNAGCYQAVLNKNLEGFDRQRWGVRPATVERLRDRDSQAPQSSPRPLGGESTESSSGTVSD